MQRKNVLISFGVFLLTTAGIAGAQYWRYEHGWKSETGPLPEVSRSLSGYFRTGINATAMPTLTRSAILSPKQADEVLDYADEGVLVEGQSTGRFYPLRLLAQHPLIEDAMDGVPILITYSPLTNSTQVYERRLAGAEQHLSISENVWNNILLMQDLETKSIWNQVSGEAIEGSRRGANLSFYKGYEGGTRTWRSVYSSFYKPLSVAGFETGYDRPYDTNPYQTYLHSSELLYPVVHTDDRLPLKETIVGIRLQKKTVAFPLPTDAEIKANNGVFSERIGQEDVLVMEGAEPTVYRAFVRTIPSGVAKLTYRKEGDTIYDSRGDRWNALSGKKTLSTKNVQEIDKENDDIRMVPISVAFWFSWVNTYPETVLYQGGGD